MQARGYFDEHILESLLKDAGDQLIHPRLREMCDLLDQVLIQCELEGSGSVTAKWLAQFWARYAGVQMYIPHGDRLANLLVEAEIIDQHRKGVGVESLSIRYGVSMSHVWKTIAKHKSEDQLCLPI